MFVNGKFAKEANRSISIYPWDDSTVITVDSIYGLRETSGGSVAQKAAIEAAEAPYQLFREYVMGSGDALDLRNDSVPASVETKLMQLTDSLVGIIDTVDDPLRTALRQEMALNALYLWNQLYFGHVNSADGKISPDAEQWRQADRRMTRWVDLDNEANALSLLFSDLASSEWPKNMEESKCDSLKKGGRDGILFANFDYFVKNYSGKNRECLLANLIFKDTRDGRFTNGIDSPYTIFRTLYPHSETMPILEEAVAKNLSINMPSELDSDIRFIEPSEGQTLDSIIGMFKDKPVLVDLWATWCGPCRKSFEHADKIRAFAKKNGIELLYVSIDEGDDRDSTVRKLVKSYGLKGNHLIMPPGLKQELYSTFGSNGILSIPSIALYGRDGKLLKRRFDESEDADALIKAIASALKQAEAK